MWRLLSLHPLRLSLWLWLLVLGDFDLAHLDEIIESETLSGIGLLEDLHPALHPVQVLLLFGLRDVLAFRHAHLNLLHLLLAVPSEVLVPPCLLMGRVIQLEGPALPLSARHSGWHGLLGELSVDIERADVADRATQVVDTGFQVEVIHLPALFHEVPAKAREVEAVHACEHFDEIVIHGVLLVVQEYGLVHVLIDSHVRVLLPLVQIPLANEAYLGAEGHSEASDQAEVLEDHVVDFGDGGVSID